MRGKTMLDKTDKGQQSFSTKGSQVDRISEFPELKKKEMNQD
jgi:hypothetical protein